MHNKKIGLLIISLLFIGFLYYFLNNINFDSVNNSEKIENNFSNEVKNGQIPTFIKQSFPNTDWSKTVPKIYNILSGGPGKDGIPAIDNPKFINISDFEMQFKNGLNIQTIVLRDGNFVKAYPYNILTWHEIVNDKIGNQEIAVTFCPLCGSALVFNRNLPNGITTFGVSGALFESNMIMYDRDTESLWQQSTGEVLAGSYLGFKLEKVEFQLMTIGELKQNYPNAQILSTDTGYIRDYNKNPYAGYEESENFIFEPSITDERFSPKEIFVAFDYKEIPVALPWLQIENGKNYEIQIGNSTIKLSKEKSELTITDSQKNIIPFYFEMWFSWVAQHKNIGIVPELKQI